jgi:hypothetical protein
MALLHGRCPLNPMTDLQQAEAQSGLFDLGRPRRGSPRTDTAKQWRDHEVRVDPAGTHCQ